MLDNVMGSWKTTVQSALSAIISFSLVAPSLSLLSTKQVAVIVTAGAIAKVVLGAFQSDGVNVPAGSTIKQTTTVQTPPKES